MAKAGIPEKLIRLTRICVEGSKSRVRVKGKLSASFEVKTGVKQRDCLSALLFNVALESNKESGRDVNRPTNRQESKYTSLWWMTEELRDMMKVLFFDGENAIVKIIVKSIKSWDIQDYNTTSSAVWYRTMVLTKKIVNKLMAFENGILRQNFGPVKEGDEWRRRNYRELINLYQLHYIVDVIKGQRLRWYGHIKYASKKRDHAEDLDSDGFMQSRKTLESQTFQRRSGETELFGEG
ncbi:hypothetical protein PR048_009896 [Dryococelus australis]|uniref:Uncharacterized protein n=1 Tax=Dryococelus australis TaxID=614101 RepID=A0ABQ9I176_9NEOP|nr:hypothetical protein PR048_009896 [Dryococelus australis]